MFRRIFGGSDSDQLRFLEWRSIVTIIALVAALIGYSHNSDSLILIAVVLLFLWGWGVLRNWFGFTTVSSLLSNNVAIGVIFFLIYLCAAYLIGIVFAFIGILRWIYLRIKLFTRR